MRCICGNNDGVNELLLGVNCKKCGSEYLTAEFVDDPTKSKDSMILRGTTYYMRESTAAKTNPALQEPGAREEVVMPHVLPKAGDHVMWQRVLDYWHHALVVRVDGDKITLRNWTTDSSGIKIIEEEKRIVDCAKKMYVMKYDKEVLRLNPTRLVLARSASMVGEVGYNILTKNCENFATFCKTGVSRTQQVLHEIYTAVTSILKAGWRMVVPVFAELIESGVASVTGPASSWLTNLRTQLIGAGLVVVVEGIVCVYNINQLYNERAEGGMSRNEFVKECITQVAGSMGSALLMVGLGLGGEGLGALIGSYFCPGVGTAIGFVVGGILGGIVGGLVGHKGGSILGQKIGRVVVSTFKSNDRAVGIDDIEVGDQLVFYMSPLHPRCHAVTVDVDKKRKSVTVIRKVFKRGIVKESLQITGTVYKVGYKEGTELYPAEERVRRAELALENQTRAKYNLITKNCKHFAYYVIVQKWP